MTEGGDDLSGDAAFCQVHCTQGQGCAKPDHCLTETNQLLEQTIEVLEALTGPFSMSYYEERVKPLLDNLKAQRKG